MSRQTVNLSDETTNLLKQYVSKRGMNNSSAIASMVSDKLDEWLMTQKKLNNNMLYGYGRLSNHDILSEFRTNVQNQALSAIVINISKGYPNSQTSEEVLNLFLKTVKTIVPDGFAGNQNQFFRIIFAKYLQASDYFQNWYQNYAQLFPEVKVEFDSQLKTKGYPSFPELNNLDIDILNQEIVSLLIRNYWNPIPFKLSNQQISQIKTFLNEHDDGLIIINGETGTGKTTLSMELSLRLQLGIEPHEIRRFYNNSPLQKVFTIHARSNEFVTKRLQDMVNMSEIQPVNLKKDTPLLLIHVDRKIEEATSDLLFSVSDIKETKY